MQFHRSRSWLIIIAAVLGGAVSAKAQTFTPFLPDGSLGDLQDMQLFAPPNYDDMDGYIKPHVGPYFRYERFYWSVHQPARAEIGSTDPAAVGFGNDNDNQFIHAGFVWGNRFELGWVNDDGSGWDSTIIKSNDQFNSLEETTPTSVNFLDPTGVLPYFNKFQPFEALNTTRFVGVELQKTIRFEPEHNGGIWELGLGARFFQFHDRFHADGTVLAGTLSEPGDNVGVVSDTVTFVNEAAPNFWDLGIDNDIVGPQIDVRWSKQWQRWRLAADFRTVFGANFENADLSGATGFGFTRTETIVTTNPAPPPATITNTFTSGNATPPGQPSNTFHSKLNTVEFAPIGEIRLDASYEVSQSVALTVGYTGLLITGIGRASDRIDYTLPDMGIINGAKRQHVYINGVNFGFTVNY